jgi:hypothetical protein
MQVILAEGFKGGQLKIVSVVFLGKGSGILHDGVPLRWGKLPQLGCRPPTTQPQGVLNVHGAFSSFEKLESYAVLLRTGRSLHDVY